MGISQAHYDLLVKTSTQFLEEEPFGPVQIEKVMEEVFGAYASRTTDDANAWQAYWTALQLYQDQTRACQSHQYVYANLSL